MSRNAFLAGRHEVKAEQPFVERDFGTLKDGADSHGEMPTTGITLIEAGAMRLALELLYVLYLTAMRTMRSTGPQDGLKMLARLVSVGENWICEVYNHG